MEEKIKALLEKEDFVGKLSACKNPEEAQKLFASEGVELSLDQIKAMAKLESGELSDDELDSVAGGFALGRIYPRRKYPLMPIFRFDDPIEPVVVWNPKKHPTV